MSLLAEAEALDHDLILMNAMFQLLLTCVDCHLFHPHPHNPSFFEQWISWEAHADKHTR